MGIGGKSSPPILSQVGAINVRHMAFLKDSGYEAVPYVCAFCGNCTMVCPAFMHLRWEPFGPRGKLHATKEIIEGVINIDEEYVRRMYLCSLCDHCTQICTTSIPLLEFWLFIRKEIEMFGLTPPSISFISKSLEDYGDPFAMGPESRRIWTRGIKKIVEPRIGKQAETLFFIGCACALKPQLHGIVRSMIKIMERAGIDYSLLGENEACCGAPLLWGGKPAGAKELAEQNIIWFRKIGAKTIVFNCPTCLNAINEAYAKIYGTHAEKEFNLLTASQFIVHLIREGALEFEEQPLVTVTYHDPCVAARKLNVIDEPREIIDSIPGLYKVEVINSGKETHCCGSHGLLNVIDPLLSSKIAEERLRQMSITPASRIITECPSCIQSLELATHTMQYPIAVEHIAQLVADALRDE